MNDWIAYFDPQNKLQAPQGELRLSYQGLYVYEVGIARFSHDTLFYDDERYLVVFVGLVLNLGELYTLYDVADLRSLISKMLADGNKEPFYKTFRGPFSGLFYDKDSGCWESFSSHSGELCVFYYSAVDQIIMSSDFAILALFLKNNNIKRNFSAIAAQWMLSFGFLGDGSTFLKEVRRLRAGKRLRGTFALSSVSCSEQRYHTYEVPKIDKVDEAVIERLDSLFLQAVRRCFEKDIEYGYSSHLVDMSGGMDSRMTNMAARRLGYSPVTNISYGQSGSEEARLAQRTSAYLGQEMIFKPLDDHEFLFDIDRLTMMNYGTYLYCGITGGERLLSEIDFSRYGLEHTGQLGDIVVGTFAESDHETVAPSRIRLSSLLDLPDTFDVNDEGLASQESYSLYLRGMHGALSSCFVRKHYTYAVSPFLDVDFLEFCSSIPVAAKRHHGVYWRWVERYYPEALQVPTTRKRVPNTIIQKSLSLATRAVGRAERMVHKLGYALSLVPSRVGRTSSMNPYEYWYDTDPRVKVFFDDYYRNNIGLLDTMQETQRQVRLLFDSPRVLDKLMALTVLSARKNFL